MDDIDKAMEKYREEKEKERLAFLKRCHDKITDDGIVYLGLVHILAHRFQIEEAYYGSGYPNVVYELLNYYVDHVDGDFLDWLHKDDGPFVKTPNEIIKIFPEFHNITKDAKSIVKLANKIYNLDLKYDYDEFHTDYIYSYSFDFNSFTPVSIDEVIELKKEIEVLKKYNQPTVELEEKLAGYGFSQEQLELI